RKTMNLRRGDPTFRSRRFRFLNTRPLPRHGLGLIGPGFPASETSRRRGPAEGVVDGLGTSLPLRTAFPGVQAPIPGFFEDSARILKGHFAATDLLVSPVRLLGPDSLRLVLG